MTWLGLRSIAARRGGRLHPALVRLLERRPADPANDRQGRDHPSPFPRTTSPLLASDVMRPTRRRR